MGKAFEGVIYNTFAEFHPNGITHEVSQYMNREFDSAAPAYELFEFAIAEPDIHVVSVVRIDYYADGNYDERILIEFQSPEYVSQG